MTWGLCIEMGDGREVGAYFSDTVYIASYFCKEECVIILQPLKLM